MSKLIITSAQAKKLLGDKTRIHTFRNPGAGMLIGCDIDRDKLEAIIDKSKCEIAGARAKALGHGLVVHDGDPLFVEAEIPQDESTLETADPKAA